MTTTMNALGRVYIDENRWIFAECHLHPFIDEWSQDPLPARCPTVAAASDDLREHLRDAHGDLFAACAGCQGSGRFCSLHRACTSTSHAPECARCHGRGWVRRSA